MSRFVSGARLGDSFTCYQFSNNPIIIAKRKIEKPGDVAQLKSQLLQLHTSGKYTNYFPALQQALADIKDSRIRRPANERTLVLITDGRRDPDDTRSEATTLAELLRRYSDLKAGEDYSFYCFYLGDWLEADLQAFLLSIGAYTANWRRDEQWLDRLTLADVNIVTPTKFLGEIPDTPTQSAFSLAFYPRRPPKDLAMLELSIEAEFTKGTLDKFFDVRPRRFVCRQQAWTETFGFETRGFSRGDYAGTLVFQPTDPQTMLLYPRTVGFAFSIAETLQVLVESPITFGPTGLRGKYEETKSIYITPSGVDFPGSLDAVTVVADIALPEGVELKVSPSLREKEIVIDIALSRQQTLPEGAKGKYEGTIRLAPHGGWAFTRSEIPVSVDVAKKGVDFRALAFYFVIVVACALAAIVLLFVIGNVRKNILDYLAHKTRPVGKLVVLRDPTRGIARNINLDRLSEKNRVKEVMIGLGREALVELPHRSMRDRAYRFSGLRTESGVRTVVEAGEDTDEVLVNSVSRTGRVQLVHLDSIKLGDFEFYYEEPRPLRQVVLYFLTGEVMQGWALSWNIETEGFRFLNRVGLPSRKESYVRFYELKAVAFVRDFDGELTDRLLSLKVPRSGHLVKLIFADQEELTGYVFDWKNVNDKFYFFPDSIGENVLFFLVERHTLKDIVLLKEDDRGAMLGRRKFERVLKRMRQEIGG